MLSNIIDRIKLHFREDKELYSALYDILGVYPHNITYYKVALMHKSIGHRATEEELRVIEGTAASKGKGGKKRKEDRYEVKSKRRGKDRQDDRRKQKYGSHGTLGKQINNERLEFLGDAILDAVVGDVVYRCFPGKPEGFLTNTRSKLVQRETLGRLAKEMGINRLILASGRSATHNSYIGGNAFEALVGALYLDHGYKACQTFWEERVMGRFLDVEKVANKEVNFKSKILEWSQKNHVKLGFSLEDQSVDRYGSPKFVYTVMLEGVQGETAEGFSKKESQQKACELTLKRLHHDEAFLDSVFAAKTERTRMEETPTAIVPDVDTDLDDAFIQHDQTDDSAHTERQPAVISETEREVDDLNFDDVQAEQEEISNEEIIAAAEAAAYAEEEDNQKA